MKNKLEMHLAAQATAQKVRNEKSQVVVYKTSLEDFLKLGIEDRHFNGYMSAVAEISYQFNAMEKVSLEPEAKTNPVPQPGN